MVHALDKDALSLKTVERWYKHFERGYFNLENNPRPVCPMDVTTLENVAAVKKLVRGSRRITNKEIEETLKISAWNVNKILHEHLQLRKLCTLCLTHILSDKQKANRVDWCKRMLLKFKSGGSS